MLVPHLWASGTALALMTDDGRPYQQRRRHADADADRQHRSDAIACRSYNDTGRRCRGGRGRSNGQPRGRSSAGLDVFTGSEEKQLGGGGSIMIKMTMTLMDLCCFVALSLFRRVTHSSSSLSSYIFVVDSPDTEGGRRKTNRWFSTSWPEHDDKNTHQRDVTPTG
jgi:hypothetical protein